MRAAAQRGGATASPRSQEDTWPSLPSRGHRTRLALQAQGTSQSSVLSPPPSSSPRPLERVPPPTGMEPVLMLSGLLASITPSRKEGLPSSLSSPGRTAPAPATAAPPRGGGRREEKKGTGEGKQNLHSNRGKARTRPPPHATARRKTSGRPHNSEAPPPSSLLPLLEGLGRQGGGKARKPGRVRKKTPKGNGSRQSRAKG